MDITDMRCKMIEPHQPLYLWRLSETGELYMIPVNWTYYTFAGRKEKIRFDYMNDCGQWGTHFRKFDEIECLCHQSVLTTSNDREYVYQLVLSGLEKSVQVNQQRLQKSQEIIDRFKSANNK